MAVSNRGKNRNDKDLEYEPDAMGRLGQGRWVPRRTRDPFGRLAADIPPPMSGEDQAPGLLDLLAPVGPGQWNLGGDVDRVESMLMRTGHLAPDPIVTGQGEFMARQEQAIKGFQRDHGLRQDGLINPKGPTHRSLLASLETMNDASNSSPETGDGAGMQAPQSEPSAADESQIAFLPALPLVPVALEGAAVFLGELLLGLGLAGAVLSLSGDTPKEEGEGPDVGGGDERANRSVKGPEPPEVPLLTTVPERFSTFLDFAFSPGWKPTWTWNESSRSWSMGPLSSPNGSMLRGRARGKSRRRPDLGPGFDPPTFDVGEIYFRCRKDVPEDMKVARAALRLIGKVASNQNQIVVHYPTLENRGPVEKGSWWWIGNDARQWLLDQPDRMTAYSVMSMRGIRPATSD